VTTDIGKVRITLTLCQGDLLAACTESSKPLPLKLCSKLALLPVNGACALSVSLGSVLENHLAMR